jgi:hypothetical protein
MPTRRGQKMPDDLANHLVQLESAFSRLGAIAEQLEEITAVVLALGIMCQDSCDACDRAYSAAVRRGQ